MNAALTRRRIRSWAEEIMGTVFSIHIVGTDPASDAVTDAVVSCTAQLRDLDRVFSPYRSGSDISRIRRGELSVAEADPRVSEMVSICHWAREHTGGLFDAWHRGWFDPTGIVKGWAAEQSATTHLAPLLSAPGIDAVGLNAGGDVRVFTDDASDWCWHIGIADPSSPGTALATVDLRSGAVATSGTAERGPHITDPRSGAAAATLRSATVVAEDLVTADLWATTAIIFGACDRSWISRTPVSSGLLVDDTGRVRRFVSGVEIDVLTAGAA